MSIGLGLILFFILVGVVWSIYVHAAKQWPHTRTKGWSAIYEGSVITGVGSVFVLVLWFILAVPVSNLMRTDCGREADGYGLDYDWSFRNGCRVELPTGQLVPSDNIRITSDGEILSD